MMQQKRKEELSQLHDYFLYDNKFQEKAISIGSMTVTCKEDDALHRKPDNTEMTVLLDVTRIGQTHNLGGRVNTLL